MSSENAASQGYWPEKTSFLSALLLQGHDFLRAVRLLKNRLDQYRHDLGLPQFPSTHPQPNSSSRIQS